MKKEEIVTIRIKIGNYELEVTGPKQWTEQKIKDFVKKIKIKNDKT